MRLIGVDRHPPCAGIRDGADILEIRLQVNRFLPKPAGRLCL